MSHYKGSNNTLRHLINLELLKCVLRPDYRLYFAWDKELELKEWIELLDLVLRALLYMLKLIRLSTKFSFIGPIGCMPRNH